MSIKMHHFLRVMLNAIFLIGGMVILAIMLFTDRAIIGFLICLICFVMSGFSGHVFTKKVPAACPQCRGRSYGKKSSEDKLYFECIKCGHIEKTGWSDSDLTSDLSADD